MYIRICGTFMHAQAKRIDYTVRFLHLTKSTDYVEYLDKVLVDHDDR